MRDTMKGTVKFYNSERGFGFIVAMMARAFFDHTQIVSPGRPDAGDPVQFELEQQPDGRTRARSVKVLR